MQRFKSLSARAINARRSLSGAVWQRGYYEHRLRDEDDLLVQARYIVANPLRRGLAERIEGYPYWWARHIRTSADL
jgi:putative transposase